MYGIACLLDVHALHRAGLVYESWLFNDSEAAAL